MSLQVRKPKTKAGKRFLEKREPKLIENDKRAMFVRGTNANNVVLQAMKDIAHLKKPLSVFYNRKNDIRPMENASSLEFFSLKSDASLFMFGSHNKKRPNNLVAGRMFHHTVLDMFEFGIESFKSLSDFKNAKVTAATKPMLLFTEGFDEKPEYQRIKNFFMDFFKGPKVEFINLKGLEHLLVFSLVKEKILFRSYKVSYKKEEGKTFGVSLEEIGPHMNLTLRRTKLASEDLFKSACKKSKQTQPKKVKNISKDDLGTTHGRLHMERQDYTKLQTRKVKGLKRRKGEKGNRPSKKQKTKH